MEKNVNFEQMNVIITSRHEISVFLWLQRSKHEAQERVTHECKESEEKKQTKTHTHTHTHTQEPSQLLYGM